MIRGYQAAGKALKFLLVGQTCACCRFTPSCSEYAVGAIAAHGVWRGIFLALKRLLRCHPWGGWGYDPVPSAEVRQQRGGCRG
ncbi:MAG: membrane protein insertion efficiency factor YidD [bacterium]